MKNLKKYAPVLLVITLFQMSGCAAGPNPATHTASSDGNIAGFWLGLWHGLICGITFIISLFYDTVSFYEVHNNGGWYNFGFVLGAGILFRGWSRTSSRRRG
ncbi:MAG: hypothetical protein WC725_04355 [Patescibacteria group bacterium]